MITDSLLLSCVGWCVIALVEYRAERRALRRSLAAVSRELRVFGVTLRTGPAFAEDRAGDAFVLEGSVTIPVQSNSSARLN